MIRVLLAIDDYSELVFIQTLLQKVGFDVEAIKSSRMYLDTALGFNPQVVIASGVGRKVKGIELARSARRRNGHPKFILLNPQGNPNRSHFEIPEVECILDSPVNIKKLLTTLADISGIDIDVVMEKYQRTQNRKAAETDKSHGTAGAADGQQHIGFKSEKSQTKEDYIVVKGETQDASAVELKHSRSIESTSNKQLSIAGKDCDPKAGSTTGQSGTKLTGEADDSVDSINKSTGELKASKNSESSEFTPTTQGEAQGSVGGTHLHSVKDGQPGGKGNDKRDDNEQGISSKNIVEPGENAIGSPTPTGNMDGPSEGAVRESGPGASGSDKGAAGERTTGESAIGEGATGATNLAGESAIQGSSIGGLAESEPAPGQGSFDKSLSQEQEIARSARFTQILEREPQPPNIQFDHDRIKDFSRKIRSTENPQEADQLDEDRRAYVKRLFQEVDHLENQLVLKKRS